MNFEVPEVLILHDIVLVEFSKAVVDQLVAVGRFQMLKNKFGEAGEKGAWLLMLINPFENLFSMERVPGMKLLC